MSDDLPEISQQELQKRVIYSLLRPATRLARLFGVPLKGLVGLLELAYFHEFKKAGLTQRQTADSIGVSRRKIAQLAAQLKQNFFEPERGEELARRIEFMLWAGPESQARIAQSLDDYSADQVGQALEMLVDQQRVNRIDGRTVYYEVPSSQFRLYQDHWMAKIDGLNNHLGSVVDSVVGRFFDDDAHAFARTLNLRMRPEDIPALRHLYEDTIFAALREFDEAAKDAPESVEMSLSINWSPDRRPDGDN